MKKILWIFLMVVLLVSTLGCGAEIEEEINFGEVEIGLGAVANYKSGTIRYYYDETHNVGIWIFYGYREGAIAVLPGDQIDNSKVLKLELKVEGY